MYKSPEMSIMTLATADDVDLGKPKPDPSALNQIDNEVVTNQIEPDPGEDF